MRIFSIFSTFVINIFRKKNIETAIGIIVLILIMVFFSAVIYSGITQFGIFSLDAELEKNYFIFVGMLCVLLFIFAGFLSAILESYECSHCEYCNRDLAYDKIGITLVEEITENGVIKEVTTKKYRCRFCGHMKYKIDKSEKYPDPI